MELATKNGFIENSVQLEEYRVHDPPQAEIEEGINTLSFPFAKDDVFSNVLDSKDEEQDHHDLDIKIEPQYDLDPYSTPIPN